MLESIFNVVMWGMIVTASGSALLILGESTLKDIRERKRIREEIASTKE